MKTFNAPSLRVRMNRGMRQGSSPARARGIGLIEVLVSVLVLAVGLLGVAAMQSTALRGGQSSLETTQAVMQTNAIIEAMRVNKVNAASYNVGKRCAATGGATLAGNDLDNWVTSLQGSVGGGGSTCGTITGCPAACVITVEWDDSRAGGLAARRLVTEASIL